MRFLKHVVPPVRSDVSLGHVTLWWFLSGLWVIASAGIGAFAIPALMRFNAYIQDWAWHKFITQFLILAGAYFVLSFIGTVTMPVVWPVLWIINMIIVRHMHTRRLMADILSRPVERVPVYVLHQHNYYISSSPPPPPLPHFPGAIDANARNTS